MCGTLHEWSAATGGAICRVGTHRNSRPTHCRYRPKQNGWQFLDDIFKCIFLTENLHILILKFSEDCSPGNIIVMPPRWHALTKDVPIHRGIWNRCVIMPQYVHVKWISRRTAKIRQSLDAPCLTCGFSAQMVNNTEKTITWCQYYFEKSACDVKSRNVAHNHLF